MTLRNRWEVGWRRPGPEASARPRSRGRGAGRAGWDARASREPRVGRALCCVTAPGGGGAGRRRAPPGPGAGRGARGCCAASPPPALLAPAGLRTLPPHLLSAGAEPAGGRRPVALRGRPGPGGGVSGLGAGAGLRAAAALPAHGAGRAWGPGCAGSALPPNPSEAVRTAQGLLPSRPPRPGTLPSPCRGWRENSHFRGSTPWGSC